MADLNNLDETLRRILSEPSTATRIALAVADALDEHPHCTINGFTIGYALQAGIRAATDGMPSVVINQAAAATHHALPTAWPGETCADYANRIRNTARGL